MRNERDITVTTHDGVRLLINHHVPDAGGPERPGAGLVVWIRTPYGRKGIASIANWFAKSGAHVVVEAARGTDGSGGRYEPFTVTAADAAAVLDWLRTQAWFPGAIVSWGISAIGYASWALTEIDVAEWRLAILQDAPSELRDGVVYPGGIFAGKVMLGSFLASIEWQARHRRASLPRTMLASVRAARRTTKVLAEPPLGAADERLVGHRVGYFQTGSPGSTTTRTGSRLIAGSARRACPRWFISRPVGTTSVSRRRSPPIGHSATPARRRGS